MNKLLIILPVLAIFVTLFLYFDNQKKEHMMNTSTCPCDNRLYGDCKCDDQSNLYFDNKKKKDMLEKTYRCPTDKIHTIIPPLVVEPRLIPTDISMKCDSLKNIANTTMPRGTSSIQEDTFSKYLPDKFTERPYINNCYDMKSMESGLPPMKNSNMGVCML